MENAVNANFDEEFTVGVQKKFLALMIFDQSWAQLNGLEIIKPECFNNTYLQRVCRFIHEYHKQYQSIPTKAALCEMNQNFVNKTNLPTTDYYACDKIIQEIFNTETGDLEYFKEEAVKFVRQTAWKRALEKGSSVLKYGNYDEALDAFKQVLNISSDNNLGLSLGDMSSDEAYAIFEEENDTSRMIQTGIAGWDRALGGGFTRRNLHIIAAPPSGGKTKSMSFLARNAIMSSKRVIYITLEMSEEEIITGIISSCVGMSKTELLTPEARQEYNEKYMRFQNMFHPELFVKFFMPGTTNADKIYNYIQRLCLNKKEVTGVDWKPDVIFLDYMDKMIPTQKAKGNMYEDVGGIANDCKNLAIKFDCPVITGSQLGKLSWSLKGDEVVSMDSIAESAQKVHLAHSMTTINFNPNERNAQKARLFVAKSRSGLGGETIYVERDLARCTMREVPKWKQEELEVAEYFVKSSNGSTTR